MAPCYKLGGGEVEGKNGLEERREEKSSVFDQPAFGFRLENNSLLRIPLQYMLYRHLTSGNFLKALFILTDIKIARFVATDFFILINKLNERTIF